MRIGDSLQGRRVMITQSDEFMGPVLARAFADHGAVVIADPSSLADPAAAEAAVRRAGRVDLLIANLAVPAPSTPATASGSIRIMQEGWRRAVARRVGPWQGRSGRRAPRSPRWRLRPRRSRRGARPSRAGAPAR